MSDKIKQALQAILDDCEMSYLPSSGTIKQAINDVIASLDAQPEAEQPTNKLETAAEQLYRLRQQFDRAEVEKSVFQRAVEEARAARAPVAAPVQPASKPEIMAAIREARKEWEADLAVCERIVALEAKEAELTRCDTSKEASDAPKQEPVAYLAQSKHYPFPMVYLPSDAHLEVCRNTGYITIVPLFAHPAAQPCQEPAQVRNAALEEVAAALDAKAATCFPTARGGKPYFEQAAELARSLQSQPAPEERRKCKQCAATTNADNTEEICPSCTEQPAPGSGLSQPCRNSRDDVEANFKKALIAVETIVATAQDVVPDRDYLLFTAGVMSSSGLSQPCQSISDAEIEKLPSS